MESYFDNIKEKIIEEFNQAEFIIYAAVAWVTDFDLISELTQIAKKGIQVELVINFDDKFDKRQIQFGKFINNGGRLFLYPCDNDSIMHNKFCVIDLCTTITGSFNWSFAAATKNKENVLIVRDRPQLARNYALEFRKLKQSSIVFDAQKINNSDLPHYVIVSDIQKRTKPNKDKFEYNRILLTLREGKKMCRLEIATDDICFIENFEPPKAILGYWMNKSKYYSLDKTEWQNLEFEGSTLYEFECTDLTFFKNISESISTGYEHDIAIM